MQITRKWIWQDLDYMLFPDPCLLCQGPKSRHELFICTSCLVELPREINLQGQVDAMAYRFWGLIPVAGTYAYLRFRKGGRTQQLLHAVKYGHLPGLAQQLGMWFATEVLMPHGGQFDLVVPVPLHKSKLRRRGYNQSLLLAMGIADAISSNVSDCLQRPLPANTQTGLSRWNRFENTQGQFKVKNSCSLENKHLLLVDDMVTTGATMAACVVSLLEAGAAKVSLAAAALAQVQ